MKKWEFRIKQYEYSLDKDDIQSRSKKNYEVKDDFKSKFLKQNHENKKHFKIIKNKIFFDLKGYIFKQLKNSGINNIELIKKDTFKLFENDLEEMMSAMRDKIKNKKILSANK